MKIKELRCQTGLSQSKFADMFGIPVSTLKDWEQGRRTPPIYVTNMIRTILEYVAACERRRKSVERVMAILLTATNGPDESFMRVLESYIDGKISLEEIEMRVDRLEYLGA